MITVISFGRVFLVRDGEIYVIGLAYVLGVCVKVGACGVHWCVS